MKRNWVCSINKAIRVVACLTCALLLVGFPLFSQSNTGRIIGTVTDQSGGVISGAAVVVTNTETGVARNLVSDAAGEFIAPNLNPGKYSVRASITGFQAFERQNIELEVGKDVRIDAQLTPVRSHRRLSSRRASRCWILPAPRSPEPSRLPPSPISPCRAATTRICCSSVPV